MQQLCAKFLLPTTFCMSLFTQLLTLVHLLNRCYAPAAYPECCRQNTTVPGYHNCRHSSSPCQSINLYENLTLRMRPAAIALNYSIKNIHNDVQQKIIMIFDEKSQFNSLVWGSLTLTPIRRMRLMGLQ